MPRAWIEMFKKHATYVKELQDKVNRFLACTDGCLSASKLSMEIDTNISFNCPIKNYELV